MANGDFPEMVVRAMLDSDFREELIKDPKRTLKIAGIRVTRDELNALEKMELSDWDTMTVKELTDKIGVYAAHKVTRVIITTD
jgi:hypothetical protein